jgi:putative methylase
MTIKRKELEILLQKIPPHPKPKVKLEQYSTPAGIAADILFEAHARGDVAGKTVVDLGCGTGIFAIGASLIGAKDALGIDVDPAAVSAAEKCARDMETVSARFAVGDVRGFRGSFDTCFQNPPFGYQNRTLDRLFLRKALEVASVVYTLHHSEAAEHVRNAVGRGNITFEQNYKLPLRYTYAFHTKKEKPVAVTLFRIESHIPVQRLEAPGASVAKKANNPGDLHR